MRLSAGYFVLLIAKLSFRPRGSYRTAELGMARKIETCRGTLVPRAGMFSTIAQTAFPSNEMSSTKNRDNSAVHPTADSKYQVAQQTAHSQTTELRHHPIRSHNGDANRSSARCIRGEISWRCRTQGALDFTASVQPTSLQVKAPIPSRTPS